ncbi:23S rRNA m(2)A-2503 methyltransferase [Clostridium sp. USBA 49]|uniref:23S rRNA (adenine(2503)-C(2))-methyltransferase RlmN n=1 Tax=Clostridium TaxID=1485 RepID=UPI00099AF4F0|nr:MULTISPECIES: 23S rRNA (adenine(2503)-C(2))-methyltransferase RlmN [Clostridium]SKA76219.1 23S rRNA m(2)A-2503 methyltransferase [Clostridium sp. USBA 49]
MINILDLTLEELKIWMKENNENEYRAKQIFDWIYKKYIWDFENMKNIPNELKTKLKNSFYIGIPKIIQVFKSKLDETKKMLLEYEDGNIIECVVMKYNHGNSICVSTQIGCKMGCKFCASTIEGLVRNLTCGEILAQVLVSSKEIGERISNVVLMGSGEPLENYDNVIKFIEVINADYGLNIGQRHITLSTCGIVPKILKLADRNMQITLAISLHAFNNELRKKIMPIAYKYSIEDIISACNYYIKKTNKRITFEYALVENVNDKKDDAEKLAKLLKGMLCHVNLIPINEVKEKEYKKPSVENIKTFYNTLTKLGIETTIRKEMGSDINAACGQLRRRYLQNRNNEKEV